MLFRPRPLLYLDSIHLATSASLISLLLYLLVKSFLAKQNDCHGFYTRCHNFEPGGVLARIVKDDLLERSLADLTTYVEFLLHNLPTPRSLNRDGNLQETQTLWSYDWTGLDQYVIVLSLLFITLFGSLSAFVKKRKFVFISILLYIVQIIQLALIEASDDRLFPANIFRDGYTVARYSIIYTSNSVISLVLKVTLLILLFLELSILVVYFCLLRYIYIFD